MKWLDKLKTGLGKTSQKVSEALGVTAAVQVTAKATRATSKAIATSLGFNDLTPQQREALEEALIAADTGPRAAAELVAQIARGGKQSPAQTLAAALEQKLTPLQPTPTTPQKPHIILLVGVNGSGKTTTLGKLAARWASEGKKVIVGAADTFRAGAVAQLAEWCARAKVPLIQAADKADPAGVAYQTVEQALKTKADIAFIDTAGRLPNRDDLMAELGKITRAVTKAYPEARPDIWLVLDATLGQATLNHLKLFKQVAGVTGLVVTKLDSSAKGGFLVPLADEKIPVVAVGVGESVEDLGDFNAQAIAQGMAGLDS